MKMKTGPDRRSVTQGLSLGSRIATALTLTTVLLLPVDASATQIGEWRGRTARACDGVCTLEWALTQLSDERREQVIAAMNEGPASEMMIDDGNFFSQMSFAKNKTPLMSPRLLRATLEYSRPAKGWALDGFDFVKIDECQNWAVREHLKPVSDIDWSDAVPAQATETQFYQSDPAASLFTIGGGVPVFSTSGGSTTTQFQPPPGGGGGGGGGGNNNPPDPIDFNPPPTDIPTIPLPSAFWLLLSAVGLSTTHSLRRKATS